MTAWRFLHVDAFADAPFTGNPAGVVVLDQWLDAPDLHGIAAELNLPATAFAVPVDGPADFAIRWFSPRGEIGLCGHGTLAAGHALMGDQRELAFATAKAGIVTVARMADGYGLSLPTIVAEPRNLPESVAALGAEPVETLWHDRGYALFRYPDEAAIRALAPDPAALKTLGDIQHIVTAPGDATDIVSRVFSSGGGEDAVTGSAHCVLTPYWVARLGRPSFTAFQASVRGGRLSCRLAGDRAVLTGQCVTVVEGRFSAKL